MSVQKTSWADDVDELAEPISDYIDENGIRTTIEYAINDEGKKVKVGITLSTLISESLIVYITDHPQDQADAPEIGRRTHRR